MARYEVGYAETGRAQELNPGMPDSGIARKAPRRGSSAWHKHPRTIRNAGLLALMSLWVLTMSAGIDWWLGAARGGSIFTLVFNSAVIAFDAVVLPVWIFFFITRDSRPAEVAGRKPPTSVAMVVTKAPSEPWRMVRTTLEAMLLQNFDGEYDVWLADEDPDGETEAWCRRHGVGMTTRRGIPEYHRETWPRRTRSKEGNLAYFYDKVGYDRYDVVAQLDADHVPEPGYLTEMVAPFADPGVGYVAAPSICDSNAGRSWSARGRLYSEALLHGAIQAGCSGEWAPSCIGSHYAVRTSHLKAIGGLGPELAEDFSTTMLMTSNGYKGAFAVDAEAHGEGPETIADCVTQDFQWSRSMMVLGLTIARKALKTAPWPARVRLGFCLAWYPLYSMVMVASVLIPILALLTGLPWVKVAVGAFYLHLMVPLAVVVAAAYWLKYCGALRPRDAKVISWEVVLFHLVRWPWALFGCLHAVLGRITGRQFSFKVTPKGAIGERPLPVGVIVPYLAIAIASGVCAMTVKDAGDAAGYYFLALLNSLIYLVVAVSIVVLHYHEQATHTGWLRRNFASALPRFLELAAVGTIVAGAFAIQGSQALSAFVDTKVPAPAIQAEPSPYPLVAEPGAKVSIGVVTGPGARNVAVPFQPVDLNEVNRFESAVRTHAGITMWFADWANDDIQREQLEAVARRGSVPEITWEPWDHSLGRNRAQPRYDLKSIADGRHDSYIRHWADEIGSYGGPVMLRFAQEMNVPGTGYPWANPEQNSPAEFRAAWRHIHDVFESEGATNVHWVWSPLARGIASRYYPGARYVDTIGLSGFNGGSELDWNGWRSFERIFSSALEQARVFAPGKPVQISEVATATGSGSRSLWIESMFRTIRRYPQIRSVIWFDVDKEARWSIDDSPSAARAFSKGASTPYFGGLPPGLSISQFPAFRPHR